nr:hypothetical protein [Tanacetum cinerariifolium]
SRCFHFCVHCRTGGFQCCGIVHQHGAVGNDSHHGGAGRTGDRCSDRFVLRGIDHGAGIVAVASPHEAGAGPASGRFIGRKLTDDDQGRPHFRHPRPAASAGAGRVARL